MNYLAIDTSSKHLTVTAVKEGRTASRYIPDCSLHHSVLIMNEIECALDELSLKPDECDFFCSVTGPGSFTGIRIGISTAKGFASGTGKPLMPLTSFEMVAYNVNDAKEFYVVIDAAHSHFYCCKFAEGLAGEPEYVKDEFLVSCGLPVYGYEQLNLPHYTQINAEYALKTAVEKKMTEDRPFGEMNALYVRKSQAEEGRA